MLTCFLQEKLRISNYKKLHFGSKTIECKAKFWESNAPSMFGDNFQGDIFQFFHTKKVNIFSQNQSIIESNIIDLFWLFHFILYV